MQEFTLRLNGKGKNEDERLQDAFAVLQSMTFYEFISNVKVDRVDHTVGNVIDANYTSVFDDSLVCTSKCKYNTETKTVFDIETADNADEADDTNAMTDEYVTIDGHRLSEEDGVIFDY